MKKGAYKLIWFLNINEKSIRDKKKKCKNFKVSLKYFGEFCKVASKGFQFWGKWVSRFSKSNIAILKQLSITVE